jgi:two-component system, NtrC family, sensor kinase
MPPDRGGAAARAILTRRIVHIPDVLADPEYRLRRIAETTNARNALSVPLLRDGEPIGAITVGGDAARPFSERQIALLKTFADQAVIAIENVRLFNETKEALERQTATGDILRVISSSPTDAQPVLEAIAESAVRLMGAVGASVYEFDGTLVHLRALTPASWPHADELRRQYPRPPDIDLAAGRVILERTILHLADLQTDPATPSVTRQVAERMGLKSVLWVPMLRDGAPIGVIGVVRDTAGLFSEKQVGLLETFADQAVIAIENVRLFRELEARNAELTQALDRQTATAEVLRVISQSQTEVQPVFDAIADNAVRLFQAWAVTVFRVEGPIFRAATVRGGWRDSGQPLIEHAGWPIDRETLAGQCILDRAPVHVADIESDPRGIQVASTGQTTRDLARARGWRSILLAPMLRKGTPIGAITVARTEAGPFTLAEIDLLETFADQAVIAVENTRLLGELRARTGELTHSVEELTALSEVSKALSSSLDLETVLNTIVARATQLAGTDSCTVYEYDERAEELLLRATNNLDEEVVAVARRAPIRRGEGIAGRMAVTREPVQIPDIAEPGTYDGPLRDVLLRTGTRALLGIPLLRISSKSPASTNPSSSPTCRMS